LQGDESESEVGDLPEINNPCLLCDIKQLFGLRLSAVEFSATSDFDLTFSDSQCLDAAARLMLNSATSKFRNL
jgi:hypothetical protein